MIRKINFIKKNKIVFEDLKKICKKESSEEEKAILLKIVAYFATFKHTGAFSDNDIEELLCNISQKHKMNTIFKYKKNSFLHIMTECYETGGHTRIVERWINNSNINQKHSIVFTEQIKNNIPKWLTKAIIKKNGDIFDLSDNTQIIDKALRLREIASEYEYIILHIHMFDIIPILAFGTKSFNRPIIFVNHADHLFWLGISISDLIINIRKDGLKITSTRRGSVNGVVLPVPLEYKKNVLDKKKCRVLIKVPENKKLIISVGSSYKYIPSNRNIFIETAINILKINSDVIFWVIGPDKYKEKQWREAYLNSKGRLNAIGNISKKVLNHYYFAADLYIESFPIDSATALIEAALNEIPILRLKSLYSPFDVLAGRKDIQANDTNELIKKAKFILNNGKSKNSITKLTTDIIHKHCGIEWLEQLEKILKKLPKKHSIYKFKSINYINKYDFFAFDCNSKSKFNFKLCTKLKFKNKIKVLYILFKNKMYPDLEHLVYLFFPILKDIYLYIKKLLLIIRTNIIDYRSGF